MTTKEKAEVTAMASEQAADAAAIESMVADQIQAQAEAEAAREARENPPPPPPDVPTEESLAGLLTIAGMAAGVAGMKRTAAVWNSGACRALAVKAVPVLRKYTWGQRVIAFLDEGAGVEEIAFAMVALPMALATMQAARADLGEKQAEGGRPVSLAGNAAMMSDDPGRPE